MDIVSWPIMRRCYLLTQETPTAEEEEGSTVSPIFLALHNIHLIENDVSGEIYFTAKRSSVDKVYDTEGLVMLCSSFSKDISPALRVGWTAPGRYKAEVEWLKFTSSNATATLPQMVIAEFLESGG